MSGSWLAQMGWDVYVVDPPVRGKVTGPWQRVAPTPPHVETVKAHELAQWLQDDENTCVIDVTASAQYVNGHIPGAWFAIRAQLAAALAVMPTGTRYVFTCASGALATYAANDARSLVDAPVYVLDGGTTAWKEAGLPVACGETHMASPRVDRYRRPYEGTDAPESAKLGYLEWEYGLVDQLKRDGTHGFRVV